MQLFSFGLHSLADFSLSNNVTVNAESVDDPTPARVTWSTTIPLECVASVRVEFRTQRQSRNPVATNTTNSTSQTEIIQTDLQCATNYYIRAVVTGVTFNVIRPTKSSSTVKVLVGGKEILCMHGI